MASWFNAFRGQKTKQEPPSAWKEFEEEWRREQEEIQQRIEDGRNLMQRFFREHGLNEYDYVSKHSDRCDMRTVAAGSGAHFLDVQPRNESARAALHAAFAQDSGSLSSEIRFDGWLPTPLSPQELQELERGAKILEREIYALTLKTLGRFTSLMREIMEKNPTRSLVLLGMQCQTFSECEKALFHGANQDTIQETYDAMANPIPRSTERPRPLTL